MALIHGFELVREEKLDELNGTATLYRHAKTGAELLAVQNNDENKVFGVTFRTPPATSNGIAHIMEHAVLAGSEKYQVKEPFVELIKGSLKTFVNAMTYPDKTVYPVASTNTQDLHNLMDVYLDAVFNPLLTKHHLEQEGWHFELDDPNEPLTYKGVVFNEMKGAYSSPEGVLGRYTQESLFTPDHPYGVDSGGDPTIIPELDYEQFKAFHQQYYHPANSRIFCYGDDNLTDRLQLINGYLDRFEPITVDSAIPLYPLRDEGQRRTYPYAIEKEEDGDADPNKGRHYISVNWLLPEIDNDETSMGLAILSHALSGTVGSPLQKRLIDSGLGEDTTGGGFSSYLRQHIFTSGLKGVKEGDVAAVEALIIAILTDLATNGIDPATIEASINTIEFRLRENNTGSFPRGIVWMLAALDRWLYAGDPIDSMRYEGALAAVKEAVRQPGYFENLIQTYLLQNHHRTTVILEPDATVSDKQEEAETARLAKAKETMTAEDLEAIIANTKELRARQEEPDDPAELAKIPSLKLSDLEKQTKSLPIAIEQIHDAEVVSHDIFTNGIAYVRVGFNLRALPEELLPYVPLFSYALTEIGTESEDFVKLSQRIGRTTGGIGASRLVSDKLNGDDALAWLFLRGKATMDRAADMLDIMRDVLLTVKLDNQERFRQMVMEEKAGEESGLIPGGHSVVLGRLRAHFSEAGWLNELTGGVTYLQFVRQLAKDVDDNWPAVLAKLERIKQLLINRHHMLVDVTLDDANWTRFRPQLGQFLASMPSNESQLHSWARSDFAMHEGLTIPAQVNYVGKAANLYEFGYTHHGAINVITNTLRTGYLWERIRMQGGAYGAFMPFSSHSGVLAFLSYRDPNIGRTLDVYDGVAPHLRELALSQDAVEKAIIGVIGNIDAYQLPDAKGYSALSRYMHGITDEYRQARRDEVLSTTAADFARLADAIDTVRQHGHVVVLGSADSIKQTNSERNNLMTLTKVM